MPGQARDAERRAAEQRDGASRAWEDERKGKTKKTVKQLQAITSYADFLHVFLNQRHDPGSIRTASELVISLGSTCVPSCSSGVWLSVASVVLPKVHRSHYRASACHVHISSVTTTNSTNCVTLIR